MALPQCSGVSILKGKCARGQCVHSILSHPVTIKPTWKDARRSLLYNLISFTVVYTEWWPVVQSETENGPSAPCPREWQVLEEEMWNCVPTCAGLLGKHWGKSVCCSGARVFLHETGSMESNRSKQEDSRAARESQAVAGVSTESQYPCAWASWASQRVWGRNLLSSQHPLSAWTTHPLRASQEQYPAWCASPRTLAPRGGTRHGGRQRGGIWWLNVSLTSSSTKMMFTATVSSRRFPPHTPHWAELRMGGIGQQGEGSSRCKVKCLHFYGYLK